MYEKKINCLIRSLKSPVQSPLLMQVGDFITYVVCAAFTPCLKSVLGISMALYMVYIHGVS